MARPVIFLAFANNKREPYLDLSEEDDGIYDLFVNAADHESFRIHRDQYTSTEELILYIQKFRNEISLFHFGGHAGDAQLYLSDQFARRDGFAALLGKQQNLKCVFLNGCNTGELVNALLDRNIPAVIATDRAIDDKSAIQLALQFYKSLTGGATIEEAFESARDAVQTTSDVKIHLRNAGRRHNDQPNKNKFPWALHFKDQKALGWRLSQAVADVKNISSYFWLRIALIFIIILTVYFWSARHIGKDSTAFFLANGPLLVFGIAAFVMKAFQKITPVISQPADWLSHFILKTPVLLSVGILVATTLTFGSSVVLSHRGDSPGISLTNNRGHPVKHWPIKSDDVKQSRLLIVSNPFRQAVRMQVEGYQPKDIKIKPILGNRLSVNNLEAKAGLLIRFDVRDFPLARRIAIRIERSDQEPITLNPGAEVSVLLGGDKTISDSMRTGWIEDIKNLGTVSDEQSKQIIDKWARPRIVFENNTFKPGEEIQILKIMYDSTHLTKKLIIDNQKINDVLLEK